MYVIQDVNNIFARGYMYHIRLFLPVSGLQYHFNTIQHPIHLKTEMSYATKKLRLYIIHPMKCVNFSSPGATN